MRVLAGCILLLWAGLAAAWEVRGEVGLEGRYFPHEGPEVKWHGNGSAYARAEVLHDWNQGRDLFTFIPYARVDEHDERRTHADIRELSWIHVGDRWESRVGIRKVFWGVTEGRHLVDIINQTDQVDQVDGEEKLGQPMINLSWAPRWGTLDVFALPGFRERTYPGEDGRPRFPIVVAEDEARYESAAENERVDFAARGQFFLGSLELAVSHFSGTSREPRLVPDAEVVNPGPPPVLGNARLIPVYDVIDQTGIELLWPRGGWLWKFEGISRSGQGERFEAATGGFEYTQVGILGTAMDLGWIVEYLWEEDRETLSRSPFEHDWLLGQRFTFNDTAGTEILWTLIHDPHSEEKVVNLEASRRLGSNFKISLEGRAYTDTGEPLTQAELLRRGAQGQSVFDGQRLTPFADDDFVQAELIWYF
jgi:hypothetical protein